MKTTFLMCVSAAVLVGCSCENKTPVPADASAQQGVAVGEPNPATPAPDAATLAPADPGKPPVDGAATLTAPATAVGGANVQVAFTGPANASDYIDLVPRGHVDPRNEITYAYVNTAKDGAVTLRAPTAAGDYDIRYVQNLSGARSVKATAQLKVTDGVATLTVPAAAETGQALTIAWTGPNGPGDYIDIVKSGETKTSDEITYAYTNAGSPAKLEAPSAAGVYHVRYVLEGPGGRKIPARAPLAVTLAKATLKAPGSVAKGAKFKVEWTGPKSSGDYIDLVPKGSTATSGEKSYFYTTSSTSDLTAPTEAGDYEIRYILEAPGGRAILARIPVQVR